MTPVLGNSNIRRHSSLHPSIHNSVSLYSQIVITPAPSLTHFRCLKRPEPFSLTPRLNEPQNQHHLHFQAQHTTTMAEAYERERYTTLPCHLSPKSTPPLTPTPQTKQLPPRRARLQSLRPPRRNNRHLRQRTRPTCHRQHCTTTTPLSLPPFSNNPTSPSITPS